MDDTKTGALERGEARRDAAHWSEQRPEFSGLRATSPGGWSAPDLIYFTCCGAKPQCATAFSHASACAAHRMVALEISLSLLCTVAASEWLHGSRRRARLAALVALAINAGRLLPVTVYAPVLALEHKLPLIATCFLGALRAETRGQLDASTFCRELLCATHRLLPMFPVLSILIAFLFLELGEVFQRVGLPTVWLNEPIYIGVLYGPFAYVYIRVKAVARTSTPLGW